MNLLWHLVKYNFIFNRIRLLFLGFLSFALCFIGNYFHTDSKDFGEFLTQYSLYIFFMILTGKMNSKNNLMFDVKHMLAMPMTKRDIVFTKSVADIVHFLPISFVFLYGIYLSKPEYHLILIAPIFYGIIVVANMIALNKRVDFSRMQHSRASFKNSFLFLHKYFEIGLLIVLSLVGIGIVFGLLKDKILLLEYSFFLLVCIAGFMAFTQTLKMLKDETRSYFIVKRDTIRIAWKGAFIAIPLFFFHKVYKDENFLKNKFKKNISKTFEKEIKLMNKLDEKQMLMALAQGNYKEFKKLERSGVSIPWDKEIRGAYPAHIAAMTSLEILNDLVQIKPDSVNMEGRHKKRTPLYSAIRKCRVSNIKYLVDHGAKLNYQDNEGVTPIMYAALQECDAAVLLLAPHSNLALKNKKDETFDSYIKERPEVYYLISNQVKIKRGLASKDSKSLKGK